MAQPAWDYIAKIVSLGDSGCGKSSLTIRLCEGRFSPHHDVTIGVEFGSRIVPVGPPASLALSINNPSSSTSPSSAPSSSPHQPAPSSPQPPPTPQKAPQKSAQKPSPTTTAPAPRQKHMKLSLWDTAGQETYKSITRSYFRGASGALLVFDISRRATFASVTSWLADLRAIADEGIVVVLVGNKADLAPSSSSSSNPDGEQQQEQDTSRESGKRQVSRAEATAWCKENGVLQYVETSAKSGEGVERAFLEVAERIFQNIEAGKYDLNDRRSGVKSAGAGGGGGAAGGGGGGGGGGGNTARTVNLGMNDVGVAGGRSKGAQGGCC